MEIHTRGLAVDVDDTVAATQAYWFGHMMRTHPIAGATLTELMTRFKFAEDVPQWTTPDAKATLRGCFYSNEFHLGIPALGGVAESLRELDAIIPVAAYITARPSELRPSTEEWLRQKRLPPAPLVMKDSDGTQTPSASRNRWKIGTLQSLWPHVAGIVDDNHGLAVELEETDYPGTVYVFGPQREPVMNHPRVRACLTWADVISAVRRDVRDRTL